MKQRLLGMAVAALVALSLGAQAQERASIAPSWVDLKALPAQDQALAKEAASEQIFNDEDKPNWRWGAVRGARVSTMGGNLLLIAVPSNGNCGTISLTIFGPTSATGSRSKLLDGQCLNDVRLRPRANQMPDLLTSVSDLADIVLHWDGKEWKWGETIESLKAKSADAPDLSKGKLGHLKRLVGTYNLVPALEDPTVRSALQLALKEHYLTLLTNLSVRPPLSYMSNCLFAEGNAPHQATTENAMLAICMDGTVHAALLTDGRRILFSPARSYREVPDQMRFFLDDSRVPTAPPGSNFEWMR